MLLPLHLNVWPEFVGPGGGTFKSKRSYMWTPETKRKKIVVRSDAKELTPERKELKRIDFDFDTKRLDEILEIKDLIRQAIYIGSQITLYGYYYISPKDIRDVEKEVRREEEEALILLEFI